MPKVVSMNYHEIYNKKANNINQKSNLDVSSPAVINTQAPQD